MAKEFQEKIKDWTALLAGLTLLTTAAKELYEALGDPTKALRDNWQWFVIPAVVALVILLWRRDRLMRWLAPRSTVAQREAFQIGRKYLKGREEDIENLLRLLSDWPLVFLVGESGAGKSSLLERGVLPELKKDPSRLAISVSTWGPDWVEGPREAVALALHPLLDDGLRKRLALEGPVPPAEALNVLGSLREKLGIIPTLVFDQFDDYQVRHRVKFLSGPNRTILGAKALARKNLFWKEIAELLRSGDIRCIFVTRTDAKAGLESVEFLPEEERKSYPLDPLKRGFAADLLNEITKNGAVDRPDRGFDRLKERLLEDLSTEGWVLPIQMQVAFSGLAELPALTPGAYENQGRIAGLEALYLKARIAAAARAVSWPIKDVLAVLLTMVDPVEKKVIPRTDAQLLEATSESKQDTTKLKDLLEKLETEEVVRQRIDPGREERVWQLDHDYLSRGLLELHRRDRRWELSLKESAQSAAGARGPWNWWQKLLPPGIQCRLLYERLRRGSGFKYGPEAGYAWASSLRMVLNLWVLIPVFAGFVWWSATINERTDRLFSEFGQQSMTPGEFRALWELSNSSPEIRRAFLEMALSNPTKASRFNIRSEAAIHAVIGLDPGRREAFAKLVQLRCIDSAQEQALGIAVVEGCLSLMDALGMEVNKQADLILYTMDRKETDLESLTRMSHLLVQRGDRLEGAIAKRAAASILRLLKTSSDHKEVARRITKIGRLDQLFSPEDAIDLFQISQMQTESATYTPEFNKAAAIICWSIWGKLDSARKIAATSALLERIVSDSTREADLLYVGLLADALSVEERVKILKKLMQIDLPPLEIENLEISLGRLTQHLDPEHAEGLLLELSTELTPDADGAVAVFGAIAKHIDSGRAKKLILTYLGHDNNRHMFMIALALPERLRGADVVTVSRKALALLTGPDDQKAQRKFLVARYILSNLCPHLPDAEIARIRAAAKDTGLIGDMCIAAPAPEALVESQLDSAEKRMKIGPYFQLESGLYMAFEQKHSRKVSLRLLNFFLEYTRINYSESFRNTHIKFSRLLGPLSVEEKVNFALAIIQDSRLAVDRGDLLSDVTRAVISQIPEAAASDVLNRLSSSLEELSEPPCGALANLVSDPKDIRTLEILKWPTCSREGRTELIQRIDGLLPDETFGTTDKAGVYHADLWKFVDWAEKEKLDVKSPPNPPHFQDFRNEQRYQNPE